MKVVLFLKISICKTLLALNTRYKIRFLQGKKNPIFKTYEEKQNTNFKDK